jgi:hypothetical protein
MSFINYTNTFADGNTTLGTKVTQNFTDITTVLNGALDGANIKSGTDIAIKKMTASTKFVPAKIDSKSETLDLSVEIPDAIGSKLKVTNSADTVLFQIDSTGQVIYGS